MRRAAVVSAVLGLACVGIGPASGTWGDVAVVSGATVSSATLPPAAALACNEVLVGLTDGARISWTPTTSPTTLVYTARVVQTGDSLTVSANSSVTLTAALLSTLLGATVTIRITGTLPGNSPGVGWVTTADRSVFVGLAGLFVNCA